MKTEFEKALEAAIEETKLEIVKMENSANVTRDFLSSIEFHNLLNMKRQDLVTMQAALKAYQKGTGE